MNPIALLPVVLMLGPAQPARGEWTVAAYLGWSATAATTLTLDQGGRATLFRDVTFDSRSFASPPYYGYRVRWLRWRGGQAGVEAELIHLKVYARAGTIGPPLERFSISHGLNLLLANAVWRQRVARGVHLFVRGGAGVAVPHGESRVAGIDQEQYAISSAAWQAAAGPELTTSAHTRAFVEYKITTAAPIVAVAGGTVSGRYTSQHLAAGLGVAW